MAAQTVGCQYWSCWCVWAIPWRSVRHDAKWSSYILVERRRLGTRQTGSDFAEQEKRERGLRRAALEAAQNTLQGMAEPPPGAAYHR